MTCFFFVSKEQSIKREMNNEKVNFFYQGKRLERKDKPDNLLLSQ